MEIFSGEAAVKAPVQPFAERLAGHGLELRRGTAQTLQVNVGLTCNQACRHCHLAAGPGRSESMDRATMAQVAAFAARSRFRCIDITGGAPELNPDLEWFLAALAPLAPRLMLRSNLTALAARPHEELLALCRRHRVAIVTSLPALNASQTDAQRGEGVLATSLAMLRKLNGLGYGRPEAGLELDLVANPTGAFLPPSQCQAEQKFRGDLARKWGIVFTRLFTFANVPLGRFRKWLKESGNFENYMERLAAAFNPATVEGLMCRTLVSVAWDGFLYDCDFNLAAGLPAGSVRRHVSQMAGPPAPGEPIATGDYCYACTAGAGFT
ncbi:MAG: arsenosugar biosynthesis radical SAM protein ArsS [Desulfobacteraceae bacterium]|nr:arsenosugar biosynthesis radical SAM protein ArsS [Desulfobacteraceae bacterium]